MVTPLCAMASRMRRNVAAGIDDGAQLSRLVEDERAVLLEGRDGNDEGLKLCHGRAA